MEESATAINNRVINVFKKKKVNAGNSFEVPMPVFDELVKDQESVDWAQVGTLFETEIMLFKMRGDHFRAEVDKVIKQLDEGRGERLSDVPIDQNRNVETENHAAKHYKREFKQGDDSIIKNSKNIELGELEEGIIIDPQLSRVKKMVDAGGNRNLLIYNLDMYKELCFLLDDELPPLSLVNKEKLGVLLNEKQNLIPLHPTNSIFKDTLEEMRESSLMISETILNQTEIIPGFKELTRDFLGDTEKKERAKYSLDDENNLIDDDHYSDEDIDMPRFEDNSEASKNALMIFETPNKSGNSMRESTILKRAEEFLRMKSEQQKQIESGVKMFISGHKGGFIEGINGGLPDKWFPNSSKFSLNFSWQKNKKDCETKKNASGIRKEKS